VSGGEGERESEVGRNKIKKTKSLSSPVAHSGEEEEEEICLKRHCFVFLSFFLCGDPKIGTTDVPSLQYLHNKD
jgi:hypothetical protein